MSLKEEIKKIKKIKGKTRGIEIKNNFECIESLEGEKARKKVEEKLKEVDMLPDYENYEDFEWYPVAEDIATLLAAKEALNWTEEDLKEHGRCLVKLSFLQKIFVKYFVSLEKMLDGVKEIWRRYFNFGEIKIIEVNREKKLIKAEVKNFDVHPSYCKVILGYFEKTLDIILDSEKIEGMETKCTFRGDKVHTFIIKYE